MSGIILCIIVFFLTGQLVFWLLGRTKVKTVPIFRRLMVGFGIWWIIAVAHLTLMGDKNYQYSINGNKVTFIKDPPSTKLTVHYRFGANGLPLYLLGNFDGKNTEFSLSTNPDRVIVPSSVDSALIKLHYGESDSSPQANGRREMDHSTALVGWIGSVLFGLWIAKSLFTYVTNTYPETKKVCTSCMVQSPSNSAVRDANVVL